MCVSRLAQSLKSMLWANLRLVSPAERLDRARSVSRGLVPAAAHASAVRAALADEAFALHFLEDKLPRQATSQGTGEEQTLAGKGTHDLL